MIRASRRVIADPCYCFGFARVTPILRCVVLCCVMPGYVGNAILVEHGPVICNDMSCYLVLQCIAIEFILIRNDAVSTL